MVFVLQMSCGGSGAPLSSVVGKGKRLLDLRFRLERFALVAPAPAESWGDALRQMSGPFVRPPWPTLNRTSLGRPPSEMPKRYCKQPRRPLRRRRSWTCRPSGT